MHTHANMHANVRLCVSAFVCMCVVTSTRQTTRCGSVYCWHMLKLHIVVVIIVVLFLLFLGITVGHGMSFAPYFTLLSLGTTVAAATLAAAPRKAKGLRLAGLWRFKCNIGGVACSLK